MVQPLIPTQTEEQRLAAIRDSGGGAAAVAEAQRAAGGAVYTSVAEANAAAAAEAAKAAGISRSIDGTTAPDAAQSFLDTFRAPKTADQIAEEKRAASQGLISSIETKAADKIATAKKAGEERLNSDNAISVLSGLIGSTEAARSRGVVSEANKKEIDAINNQKASELASLYSTITKDAQDEARQQLEDATKSAQDIVARRGAAKEKALANVTTLAKGGLIDFDSFKTNPKNKQVYDYAVDAAGGEEALRATFAVNRPKDQIVGTPTRIGNSYVQAYSNPITGTVKYEKIDLPVDIPAEYTHFERIGKDNNTLIAVPDNWDGDPTKIKTIYAGGVGGNGSGTSGYNQEFAQTIELAGGLFGSVYAQKAAKDQLKSAIASKDYKSAYQGIVSATAQGLSGENKTKFENAAIDQTLLHNMSVTLQAYKDAGGSMDIFKGTADDIGKRLGVLANDPKYASIATQLDRAFQQYRQNMTGAAFSADESADYAKVVPGKGKSIDLNLATIKGALDYANNYVEGSIKAKTGEGGVYIKQYAEGAKAAPTGDASASDLSSAVAQQGYDYAAMKADGLSDEQIRAELGL
ncbi:MAG: hypothetical protein ACK4UO_13055 [Pseudolabrys sp.]